MRPIVVTVSSATSSNVIPMDWNQNPFSVGFGVIVSGTLTYTVQYTFSDIFADGFTPASASWFDHPVVASQSGSNVGNFAFPVRGVRLNVSSWTSGTATLTVIQSGGMA